MSLVTTTDPVLIQTYEDYLSIVGVVFMGVYSGKWTLERDGKIEIYSVINLRFDPREISPVLLSIATNDHTHWKAMTGPDHTHPQSEYQLWTTSLLKEAIQGQCQNYTIMGVACFLDQITVRNVTYNGGVELDIQTCD